MSYLVREIEAYQRCFRGHECLTAALVLRIDALEGELQDIQMMLAQALQERDEAQDLLTDLQREKVPALVSQ